MDKFLLTNLKCFSDQATISLSDITINVGMNSVGKSTFTQAVLLCRQTYDKLRIYSGTTKKDFHILLNGPYGLQMGDYDQIIPDGRNSMTLETDGLQFRYQKNGEDKFSLALHTDVDANTLEREHNLFAPHFYYLNAERQGPRNFQNIGHGADTLCGYHGEYTFEAIEQYRSALVEEGKRRCGDIFSVNIFSKQLEYWMDYIVPGVEFRSDEDSDTRTAKLKIRQITLDTEFISPHNFGFGISYILPIIVTGLLAKPGSVMIVENPEAHLHPSGQSRIGRFLAQIAACGVQVIIETHSEHVVNGIRLHALKNQCAPETICINYFSIQGKTPHIERIELNDKMDIMKWPDGFFDQEEKDLQELRHLRRSQL